MRFYILIMLFLTCFLQSCLQDDINPTPSEAPSLSDSKLDMSYEGVPFSIIDGTIHLNSEDDLNKLIAEVVSNSTASKGFFRAIPGYTSSEQAYDNLMLDESVTLEEVSSKYDHILALEQIDGDTYVVGEIDEEGISLVMNEYGRVVAGNYVYDFSGPIDGKLLLKEFDLDDVSFRAHTQPDFIVIGKDAISTKSNIVSCRDTDGNRRVLGQLEKSRIFSNIDPRVNFNVRTRHFRRRFGAWFGVQADRLESNWDLWITHVSASARSSNPAAPTLTQRFRGTHTASRGDRQNTRARLLSFRDAGGSFYERSTNAFGQPSFLAGPHRATHSARDGGQSPRIDCNL